jgi:hypothetical protein
VDKVTIVVWSSGMVDFVVWQMGSVVQHICFSDWKHALGHYGVMLPWMPNVRVTTTGNYRPNH